MELALGLLVWLFLMLMLEKLWPRRAQTDPTVKRVGVNLLMGVINWALVRLLVPGGLVVVAFYANGHLWGLWEQIGLNDAPELFLSIVLLDLAIWAQHLVSHKWAWLWRIHRVHHLDISVDASTAVRFHPAEIIISLGYKAILIVSLGISPLAIASFEIMLAASAMFNHANLNLSIKLDKVLRKLIVTPDMHRIHHSTDRVEHDSNYGFFFSFWDRLFGAYTEAPKIAHTQMPLGLHESRDAKQVRNLGVILRAPFFVKV
ncbi:MAG: sterol desaturase family protein [Proteobacteria bacterium]|nr:sterol desaturase family protein [Pseudomonadota bacterium]